MHPRRPCGLPNFSVFLVTIHDPVCTESGDLGAALHGSFFPTPSTDLFPLWPEEAYLPTNLPGAIVFTQGRISINSGDRRRIRLKVTNKGDRPVQVGSHYHFIETNPWLEFDRAKAYGMRLDIAAGTAVRFEPGDRHSKTVQLVEIGGLKRITGGNNLATGVYDPERTKEIVENLVERKFLHKEEEVSQLAVEVSMSREEYASMFGPTTGDKVRLGDTSLWIEIERDSVSA